MSSSVLTINHGDDLAEADVKALQVVRLTLLGLAGHGFITGLETYSTSDITSWSYRAGPGAPGLEDAAGIMAGLLDILRVIAPGHWIIKATP